MQGTLGCVAGVVVWSSFVLAAVDKGKECPSTPDGWSAATHLMQMDHRPEPHASVNS